MMYPVNAGHPNHIKYLAAAAGVLRGQMVRDDGSNKAVAIAAEIASADVLGIAMNTATSGQIVDIYPLSGTFIEIGYYASATKKTCADTDIGTDFDINVSVAGDMTLDLDDTSGSFILMQYDNTSKKAIVAFPEALQYIS
jgi:hypothetical protein